MTFGQPSGPPASAKQVKHLLSLLEAAGHADFRDARGPMGFTQRQAAGKFTRDEVETYIEALELAAETEGGSDDVEVPTPRAAAPSAPVAQRTLRTDHVSAAQQTLRRMPSEMLAAELQRRGWVVVQP